MKGTLEKSWSTCGSLEGKRKWKGRDKSTSQLTPQVSHCQPDPASSQDSTAVLTSGRIADEYITATGQSASKSLTSDNMGLLGDIIDLNYNSYLIPHTHTKKPNSPFKQIPRPRKNSVRYRNIHSTNIRKIIFHVVIAHFSVAVYYI